MSADDYLEPSSATRRLRVTCRDCGVRIEIVRLREHLRATHHLDSSGVEAAYLAAMMDVRKSRRDRA